MKEDYIDDLRLIGRPTFAIVHVANDVFRIHVNSARRKVQMWTGTGAVKKVDEVPNPPNRPSHLFGVSGPRVAIAISPNVEVDLMLDTQIFLCPSCRELCTTDESEFRCIACSARSPIGRATSLLGEAALTPKLGNRGKWAVAKELLCLVMSLSGLALCIGELILLELPIGELVGSSDR